MDLLVAYFIGIVVAILWHRIEKWSTRDPLTLSSNILLAISGWLLVPLAMVGFFFYWLTVGLLGAFQAMKQAIKSENKEIKHD
jgi:hypothetical protein